MSRNLTAIGLISDTHGLLRQEALHALEGSELIIHAGDVGKSEIIDALKAIAPVFAVRGNVERNPGPPLPETEVVTTGPQQSTCSMTPRARSQSRRCRFFTLS